jgi:soluble lytic murein transglycosylase-like protein
MYAKSVVGWDRSHISKLGQRARNLVSTLVLLASLSALLLIVNDQHGRLWSAEGLQRAFPEGLARKPREAATLSAVDENRYRALSEFVAKRYRVSPEMTFDLLSVAHNVGQRMGLDPLLIIAVIAVESRFNPIAESVAGAKGLMQIIPKLHIDKLEEHGGDRAVFDPATNILVGAQILKEYIRLTGNLGIALQMYAGALGDNEDQYTTKVLNEKQRLNQVLTKVPALGAPTKPAGARGI